MSQADPAPAGPLAAPGPASDQAHPLADARWPEVAGARRDLLVVPTGSLEQHGPHLPLDTDTVIAAAVAARLHALRPGSGLAPALPFGASGEHAGFPGTVSIGTEAVRHLVLELVRHACSDWRGVLVVNGHGGNAEALAAAREACRHEGRALAVTHLGVPGGDAHAGRTETSIMLHLDPFRVRADLAAPGATAPLATLMPALRRNGVRAVSESGVLGDPTGASATEGAMLIGQLVARTVDAYDRALSETAESAGAGATTTTTAAEQAAGGPEVGDR